MSAVYEHRIEITAAPDRVWSVMVDVERWSEWTASIQSVELLDGIGVRPGRQARVRQPKLPDAVWIVDRFEDGRNFSWSSAATGLRSVGEHSIEDGGPGTCRVVLRLTHSGPLAGVVKLGYGRLIRRYLQLEAEGLKRESEAAPSSER